MKFREISEEYRYTPHGKVKMNWVDQLAVGATMVVVATLCLSLLGLFAYCAWGIVAAVIP